MAKKTKYGFNEMEVGDERSFPVKTFRDKQRVRSAAYNYGAFHSKALSCFYEDGEMRVVRTG